ncbi:MAG: hypothetical protein JXD22_04010 [Sedimentisphaerales bacterium]|nr:hypothetical protein [Sedimentisphaerales bacterium]
MADTDGHGQARTDTDKGRVVRSEPKVVQAGTEIWGVGGVLILNFGWIFEVLLRSGLLNRSLDCARDDRVGWGRFRGACGVVCCWCRASHPPNLK